MSDSKRREVWTVADRGEGRKGFWLRIGTAFENKDGSWSLVLDALPVNGKLIVRDERPREDQANAPPRRADTRAAARAHDDFGGPSDDSGIPF